METHLEKSPQAQIDAADEERSKLLVKIVGVAIVLYAFVYVVTYLNAEGDCLSRGAASAKVDFTLKAYCVVAGVSAPLDDVKRIEKSFPRR